MSEQWKSIDGFESYEVSALGRVRSLPRTDRFGRPVRGGFLSPCTDKNGYVSVRLSQNGKKHSKLISRLVAIAFIPNPSSLPEVNHCDGDRSNNTVKNLEWVTESGNIVHSYQCLGRTQNKPWLGKFGADHNGAKAVVGVDSETGKTVRFEAISDAVREGYSYSGILRSINGTRKTHKGFVWSYACQK